MPRFRYTAMDRGSRREGILEAVSPGDAAVRLRAQGLILLGLQPVKGNSSASNKRGAHLLAHILIRPSQIENVLGQLAQVIKAGVPILPALESVGAQAPRPLARVMAAVTARVKSGQSLEKSMQAEAPFFGKVTIGLIGVGESNGTLDGMLRYAASLMERTRKVRSQVLGALAYPCVVIIGAMGLGWYMVQKVIPQIMSFIGTKDPSKLPLVTQYLVYTTDFLKAYGAYILITPPLLVIAFVLARRYPTGAVSLDRMMLWIPPIGKALREHANTMWCRTLGALLGSGINILQALDLVIATSGNAYYAERFKLIKQQVRQGVPLGRAFFECGMKRLCPMAHTLISVSEESGALDESLLHVADYCEEQLTRRVALLAKMVEPTIFVLVGGMVGFVYFAFFLAMLAATNSAAGR